ncbi:hypothetical protein SpCBS45565_g01586 [Spizellomyces sp. 'palustris']|nr:hypothetical protein SpCBS45565_g01586 [Spizellomyces sp. 'palustris']
MLPTRCLRRAIPIVKARNPTGLPTGQYLAGAPPSTRYNSSTSNKKVKDVSGADKRYQLIRDILYSREVPTTQPKPIPPASAALFTAPVATDPANRRALKRDAIERAWAILKEREAVAKVQELRGMYESMRSAMEELERTDRRLFEAAKVATDREVVVVFPRRLRVPTDTPPLEGWDYDMKTGTR